MLKYLIKTEIDGIEIRLIESRHALVVLYGMENTAFRLEERKAAIKCYKNCVLHAMEGALL